MSLIHQRCFHHRQREAAARCPECGRFYCRECITEHENRVICAACLKQLASPARQRRWSLAWPVRSLQFLAGLFLVWLFFYWLGQSLLAIPSSFHDATLWKESWLDSK